MQRTKPVPASPSPVPSALILLRQGTSLKTLAERTRMPLGELKAIEAGTQVATVDQLAAILQALGRTWSEAGAVVDSVVVLRRMHKLTEPNDRRLAMAIQEILGLLQEAWLRVHRALSEVLERGV